MQFKVDPLQNKLSSESCVGKKKMKKINVKRRKWRKKHHEAETVNQKGGGQKHRQMEMWIKLQR